jgi:hypothetical protein
MRDAGLQALAAGAVGALAGDQDLVEAEGFG